MGQGDAPLVVDVDQAVRLQGFEDVRFQLVQRHGQGLGEGEAFEGVASARAGPLQRGGEPLTDGRGDRQRTPPGPFAGARHGRQPAGPGERGHQIAQQPQIAPARPVQPAHGERLQPGAGQQLGGVLAGQRAEGQPGQQLPGPQPGHRGGRGHAVRRGHDQSGAPVHGQLVHQGGGGLVQQLRVVHHEDPHAGQHADRARGSDTVSGSRCANAARGSSRASGVPVTRAWSVPRTASVISRVLPWPAGPVSTMPGRPAADAPRTSSSSSTRPVNGQGDSRVFASCS
ncbi:hypothetical protein GCM10017687_77740 [Streptomyces echinatus]